MSVIEPGMYGPELRAEIDRALGTTDVHLASEYVSSYTDNCAAVIGREYLGTWFKYWRSTNSKATVKIIGSGDSTMEATSVGTVGYKPNDLITRMGYVRGFPTSFVNDGKSGQTSAQWLATHLPALLTTHSATPPKLLILSWGRNDPASGITPAQTIANITAGIALIRATWNVNTTSILVVPPNTASEDGYGRNETWNEVMAILFKQTARELGFCFVDFYKLFREARYNLTTSWLDASKLHANEDLYLLEYGFLADVIFPQWLADWRSGPFSVTLASGNPATLSLPGAWPLAVYRRGQVNHLKGSVSMFNSGALAAGTAFFTIPVMGRSSTGIYFKGTRVINTAASFSLRSNLYDVLFYAGSNGAVVNVDPINEASTSGAIYFDGATWVDNIYDATGNVFAGYTIP